MERDSARDSLADELRPRSPFLRWIGGKRKLAPALISRLPGLSDSIPYHEPFLGAGSVFFSLLPERAHLSDSNAYLMNCYRSVQEQPDAVAEHLDSHAVLHSKQYYYEQRRLYNDSQPSVEQAARFIYLNKACFNGIFRVNKRGEFNVPWGAKEQPALPTHTTLLRASAALSRATLSTVDYADALEKVAAGEFVYIDPPYPAPTNGSSFALYTSDRFGPADHGRLMEAVRNLDSRGALFMMSNADTPQVREQYRAYRIDTLAAVRYVTCKNKKYAVQELVITNY